MRNSLSRILSVVGTVLFVAGCASTPPPETAKPEVAQTKAADAEPAVAVKAVPATISYNVTRGDHLWGISSKPTIYGNPYSWPLIFKANRDKIKDPDLIEPGQIFAVEKNPSGADLDAAVKHAKTRGAWTLGASEKSDLDYLSRYGVK